MASARKTYTLTELSKKSGVSLPTLQRYKKLYQDRLPSEGSGRKQRFPQEAVKAVRELKRENLKNRGRKKAGVEKKKSGKRVSGKARTRRKGAARKTRRAPASPPQAGLLSLAEIGRRTRISYPTLIKYVKVHGHKIPHQGSGRKRRFPEEAVKVFEEIRGASRRGRKRGSRKPAAGTLRASGTDAALAARVRKLEKAQRDVNRQLQAVVKMLKKPMQLTIKPR